MLRKASFVEGAENTQMPALMDEAEDKENQAQKRKVPATEDEESQHQAKRFKATLDKTKARASGEEWIEVEMSESLNCRFRVVDEEAGADVFGRVGRVAEVWQKEDAPEEIKYRMRDVEDKDDENTFYYVLAKHVRPELVVAFFGFVWRLLGTFSAFLEDLGGIFATYPGPHRAARVSLS